MGRSRPGGAPPLAEDVARETIKAVEDALREGYPYETVAGRPSARSVAAERLKIAGPTLHNRLDSAKRNYGLEPDEGCFIPPRYQQPHARLQLVPAPAPRIILPEGEPRHILVIPDRHNDPRHPHRLAVTKWIARFGSEQRFGDVVCLGDDVTFDSVSRHDKNDTLKGRMKPFITDDLDNHEAMETAFEAGRAKDWKPRKYRCRGNHNQRLFDYENLHPETNGALTHRYLQTLLQFGWRERSFGEILYLEGIGFTHAPFNGMGKPMAGKTATHRAGALLTKSLVHGHTHSFEVHNAAKLDTAERVTVIQAGCALPENEVEHYATHNPTGWSYGVLDLTVHAGEIVDLAFVSMRSLRARYSDDGADVRAA